MNERYLKLEVVWKDEDMFELKVLANNWIYSGTTGVYEQSESLLEFIDELKGFSFRKDKVKHSCWEKDSYAYFEMKFYKIGLTGKCGLQIILEENVATEYRKEEKDKLTMELIVEPNSIDIFCQEFKTISWKRKWNCGIKSYWKIHEQHFVE